MIASGKYNGLQTLEGIKGTSYAIAKLAPVGFKQGGNFTEGAMYVANSLKKYPNDFPSNTIFEFTTKTTADNIRRVDVKVNSIYFEFKSVKLTNGMPPSGFANQFIKDLDLPDVTNLNQLKWWFDASKTNTLSKTDFLNTLQQGTISQTVINKFVKGIPNPTKLDLIQKISAEFDNIFFLK